MLAKKNIRHLTSTVIFASVILSGCGDASDKSSQPAMTQSSQPAMVLPSYELVEDRSFSDADATKVMWDIVVPKTVTKESLTALLNSLYEKEKAEHSNAAVISIYAYADKDHQQEGMGRWLAWLMTNDGLEKAPTIQYDDKQINGLGRKPEVKFGQMEDNRKLIYKEIIGIEDDYPDNEKAQDRERNYTAKSLHLTRKQLDAIADEGQQKEWVMPAPPKSSN